MFDIINNKAIPFKQTNNFVHPLATRIEQTKEKCF